MKTMRTLKTFLEIFALGILVWAVFGVSAPRASAQIMSFDVMSYLSSALQYVEDVMRTAQGKMSLLNEAVGLERAGNLSDLKATISKGVRLGQSLSRAGKAARNVMDGDLYSVGSLLTELGGSPSAWGINANLLNSYKTASNVVSKTLEDPANFRISEWNTARRQLDAARVGLKTERDRQLAKAEAHRLLAANAAQSEALQEQLEVARNALANPEEQTSANTAAMLSIQEQLLNLEAERARVEAQLGLQRRQMHSEEIEWRTHMLSDEVSRLGRMY